MHNTIKIFNRLYKKEYIASLIFWGHEVLNTYVYNQAPKIDNNYIQYPFLPDINWCKDDTSEVIVTYSNYQYLHQDEFLRVAKEWFENIENDIAWCLNNGLYIPKDWLKLSYSNKKWVIITSKDIEDFIFVNKIIL